MSADFWAGYISGAVGIVIGNPLDLLKVRLQAKTTPTPAAAAAAASPALAAASYLRHFESPASLVTGSAAPILGYGALNALLFVSYNRTEAALNRALDVRSSLWTTWLAGAVGGLATWVVSTPTELIKCRAQLSSPPTSSWAITRDAWRAEGLRGLYFGGTVTALRDSIGYGFYFWSYELATRWMGVGGDGLEETDMRNEAAKVLLCGGLAGIVTWASIFPLDVIKTRVQMQAFEALTPAEGSPLLGAQGTQQQQQQQRSQSHKRAGAVQVAKAAYREGGMRVFFRGLTICSVRAFVVNAVQWAVYEWVMYEMGQGRKLPAAAAAAAPAEPAGQVL
ncbi:mitochondrial carrier [Colletotrichum somersetense]|nr:mitochondrial carrier [Colletotrichum somersetense]